MNETSKASLSALMDGEANELELRRVLRLGGAEADAVNQHWSDLHQQREALRGGESFEAESRFAQWDISQAVSAAIAEDDAAPGTDSFADDVKTESGDEGNEGSERAPWYRPLASVALAASVAAVVVFGFGELGGELGGGLGKDQSQQAGPQLVQSPAQLEGGRFVAHQQFNSNQSGQAQTVSTVSHEQLREAFAPYVQHHADVSAQAAASAVLSYARHSSQETADGQADDMAAESSEGAAEQALKAGAE